MTLNLFLLHFLTKAIDFSDCINNKRNNTKQHNTERELHVMPKHTSKEVECMSKYNYIIYETTCLYNSHVYVGIHKQLGLEFDGYLGSGTRIINAYKKHGKEKFVRKTLFVYDNLEEALEKEREIVNEEFIKRKDTFNLILGGGMPPTGSGEDNPFYGRHHTEETKDIYRFRIKERMADPERWARFIEGCKNRVPVTEDTRKKFSEHAKALWADPVLREIMTENTRGENNGMFGKKHSEETKKQWSEDRKNPPKFECPYCKKCVSLLNFKKWHGDNCKKNPNRSAESIAQYEKFKAEVSKRRKGVEVGKSKIVTCPYCSRQGSARGMWKHIKSCELIHNQQITN